MSPVVSPELLAEDKAVLDRAELARSRLAVAARAREIREAERAERVVSARAIFDQQAPVLEDAYQHLLGAIQFFEDAAAEVRSLRPVVESAHALLVSAGENIPEMPRRLSVRYANEDGMARRLNQFRGTSRSDL